MSFLQVSCQFPILEIWDLSSNNTDNHNRNGWEVTKPFPTLFEIEQLNSARIYNATVWSRVNEELTFHVKFGAGSHIRVAWTIEVPDDVVDDCKTVAKPSPIIPFPVVTGSRENNVNRQYFATLYL
jgi:hypothetical protein